MNLTEPHNIQHLPEPLEIQMYGSWTMSFPTWLVIQLGTYVLLLLLLVGSYEVLFPTTGVGEHIHHILKKEPYAWEAFSWVPLALLLTGVVEFCETMMGLFLFCKKRREIIAQNKLQKS